MSKNEETLKSFVVYCKDHPDERFWQALRNWSGYTFIYGYTGPTGIKGISIYLKDTFYKEGMRE